MDFVGFALVSGGDDNGKYVDGKGNLYRYTNGKMIAVETGTSHVAVEQEQEGKLIGGPLPPSLPGGKHQEKGATPTQLAEESSGEPGIVGTIKEPPSDEELESLAEEVGATVKVDVDDFDTRVASILSDNTADEVRLYLMAARNRGMDVAVLQGDDEATVRANAEALARITTE